MLLNNLLAELEKQGSENDAKVTERKEKFLNITRDTGEFLAVLVKATKAHDILEIGTSNGYSTLWLANSLPETGNVTTVEALPHKIAMAKHNFATANLAHKISLIESNAVDFFQQLKQQFDIIFLDADRSQYMLFAAEVIAALKPGGLLIIDNAVSHESELANFIDHIKSQSIFTTSLIPVGKGEFVAYKQA
ncbi:MAG: O-methyltransferase [Anaerolineales bacterium]|nr:O-methyltransferase [Anaerolineales bacterium]